MPKLIDMGIWNKNHGFAVAKEKYYCNTDSVEKVIRYITRTRFHESRAQELISFGCSGISNNSDVEYIISQFEYIQKFYDLAKNARKLYHEAFIFNDEEFNMLNRDYALVEQIAQRISAIFFEWGFQVVYAVHHDAEKKVHIHIVINCVRFLDGGKLHLSYPDFDMIEMIGTKEFNEIVENLRRQDRVNRYPICFI